jgi:Domain of Unknown Function (DUF928)
MIQTPFFALLIFRSLTLISLLLGFNGLRPTLAAPATPRLLKSSIRWTPPPPPPNLGDPGGRGQGGGSRGSCDAYKTVSALLPRSQSWGLTTQTHPTFWLNLPKGLADQVPLEISLQNRQGKPLFKKVWNAALSNPGIVHLSLPQDAPALQINQQYRWSIAIYCDAENPDTPVMIRGTIGRVDLPPSAADRLTPALSAIDKATLYAEQGIWYDAVTTLGLEQLSQPTTSASIAWNTLLQQAGLSSLRSVPVQSCCQPDAKP